MMYNSDELVAISYYIEHKYTNNNTKFVFYIIITIKNI